MNKSALSILSHLIGIFVLISRIQLKSKGKGHNTYIAPLPATAASIALFVTG